MNQLINRSLSDRFCHEATIKISSRFFDEAIRFTKNFKQNIIRNKFYSNEKGRLRYNYK